MSLPQARRELRAYRATNFAYETDDDGRVATITLSRPERKNPLTFESYAELRDLFRALALASDVKAVVITGAGGNFSSGGDVHDIIGPLTPAARTAFLFVRVGLAGCDMGACALLPRTIGQGRAAELLYTGRVMTAEEGLAWGFFNSLAGPQTVLGEAQALARSLADGPTLAHAMTKEMLHREWAMPVDAAIDAEAVAQAICMQSADFHRAYEAFIAKQKPRFEGK